MRQQILMIGNNGLQQLQIDHLVQIYLKPEVPERNSSSSLSTISSTIRKSLM